MEFSQRKKAIYAYNRLTKEKTKSNIVNPSDKPYSLLSYFWTTTDRRNPSVTIISVT